MYQTRIYLCTRCRLQCIQGNTYSYMTRQCYYKKHCCHRNSCRGYTRPHLKERKIGFIKWIKTEEIRITPSDLYAWNGSLRNNFYNFHRFELKLCRMVELCFPKNRTFWFSILTCFGGKMTSKDWQQNYNFKIWQTNK